MRIRRIASAAATVIVAIAVALAVPVAQLRTFSLVQACCCPDPANCHCPDHQPDHSGVPSMRPCHKTQHAIGAPEAPAFVAISGAIVAAPRAHHIAPLALALSPPPAPDPSRPDAPS